jgi:thiol-disulfide isomerase/thioredoxin
MKYFRQMTIILAACCLGLTAITARADEVVGIGVAMSNSDGTMIVKRILEGTPAAANKLLKLGDQILAVGEGDAVPVSTDGKTLAETVSLLRGRAGTTVRLTIVPAGENESSARVVSLVRAELKLYGPIPARPGWGDGTPLAVGSRAPDIRMTSLSEQKPERLSDFVGKVVVIKFWNTSCGPCLPGMAELDSYAKKYPEWSGKVVLIAASAEDEEATADMLRFVASKRWKSVHFVRVDAEARQAFHVAGVPTTYVIDPRGNVAIADSTKKVPETVTSLIEQE